MKEKEDDRQGQGNQSGKTASKANSGKSTTKKADPKKKTGNGKTSK
jgi:hypothetical protein